jgi:hypothetical protein
MFFYLLDDVSKEPQGWITWTSYLCANFVTPFMCDSRLKTTELPGGPLTCGIQSTYNRVANADELLYLGLFGYIIKL